MLWVLLVVVFVRSVRSIPSKSSWRRMVFSRISTWGSDTNYSIGATFSSMNLISSSERLYFL